MMQVPVKLLIAIHYYHLALLQFCVLIIIQFQVCASLLMYPIYYVL